MKANSLEEKQHMTRTIGRTLRRLVVLVPVSVFLSVGPALAHEGLSIKHQPPPAALEGADVELVVIVHREGHQGDALLRTYGPIVVTVHYQAAGRTKAVSAELAKHGGAARLTIPGRDVEARMLRYWLTARQESCFGLWSRRMNCEEVSVRAPEQSMHIVPVQSTDPEEASRPSPRRLDLPQDVKDLRNAAIKPLPPPPPPR